MSFLNNIKPDKMPGTISGNALNGLCEKTCIQVNKVFDACIKQESFTDVTVSVTNIMPTTPCPVTPYKFISCKSTSSKGTVSNLSVTPIDDDCGCASRVKCDVCIPIEIVFSDANCRVFVGSSQLVICRDIKLNVPRASIMPYEIEAVVNLVSPEGTFICDNQFVITACVTSVIKVVMSVELLIPSYGYCCIPSCVEFKEEVCDSFFDLPLFPQDNCCKR